MIKRNKVLKKIKHVEGIEKVIWAYSGVKKCSDFKLKDENIIPILNSLGLEYDRNFIKVNNWPSWGNFAKKYQKEEDYMFDLATGLFYDLPFCCAGSYQVKVIESSDKFFSDHPFKGKNTLKEVLKLSEESASLYDNLRKHEETYGFKENYDKLQIVEKEVLHLISSKNLPESMFLLLGLTYVPCKPNCNNFLAQSETMFKDLKGYLGDKQAKKILEEYKQRLK